MRQSHSWRRLLLVGLLLPVLGGQGLARQAWAASRNAGPVTVTNLTRPTQCAEEDNVRVDLAGPARRFTSSATHPAYLNELKADNMAPDFAHCNMSADPVYTFTPGTTTLFEDGRIKLVGITYEHFWRPNQVPLHIDGRTISGLHLLQLFDKGLGRPIEILVLYPADGYWRAKPLPPVRFAETGYGSSFLIGPIVERGRPLVEIAELAFDPADRRFDLSFADGGSGSLRVVEASRTRVRLAIALDVPGSAAEVSFAALRSMFVSRDKADVADIAWRSASGGAWHRAGLGTFSTAAATTVRFGRSKVSIHNSSAPDLSFGEFESGP